MPQHGEVHKNTSQIYCGYWMNLDEWEEIHKYSPDIEEFAKTREENSDEK